MSAVEERTAAKRPMNDKDDHNEVAATKEPRLENGKTEDEVQVIKEKKAPVKDIEAADHDEEDDDEDVDDEEVHDESSEGEGDGSEGEGDDDEGDSGEEEDGDDAEGGEESD
ncbi:hypothetical protein OESDEN_04238 [Oesophagostomum dentatum]|uniref:Uncharacterized protein n=1 Tax=Oesophagostomum dentatum TaxID=61180 RepID=A0A0B1TEW0_OESDE|nr:hypothetical protein OESDEN_04238 [Oesophagostomum dentatum]